jgi:hypothetical protein
LEENHLLLDGVHLSYKLLRSENDPTLFPEDYELFRGARFTSYTLGRLNLNAVILEHPYPPVAELPP